MDALPFQLLPVLQLVIAMLLGMLLGMERSIVGKKAGMRTFALASLGSCLFVIISEQVVRQWVGIVDFDPLRVAAGVITGIGFIGAGMIIFHKELRGLTTAASLWVAAGIGMAVGFGLYSIAIATTVLTLFVFTALWYIERYIERRIQLPERDPAVVLEERDDRIGPQHL